MTYLQHVTGELRVDTAALLSALPCSTACVRSDCDCSVSYMESKSSRSTSCTKQRSASRALCTVCLQHVAMLSEGFVVSNNDPCLVIRGEGRNKSNVLVHVDDSAIQAGEGGEMNILEMLGKHFEVKDLGPLHFFLGQEGQEVAGAGLLFKQPQYAKNVLQRANMWDCTSTTKADYISAAMAVQEALRTRKLLGDTYGRVERMTVHCDIQSALHLMKRRTAGAPGRSKHIDIQYHFIRNIGMQCHSLQLQDS